MSSGWQQEIQKIMEDKQIPINKKADGIVTCLLQAGVAYRQKLVPSSFVCHTDNRSGQMLNPYDVHMKGKAIASIGFSFSKLAQSVCFELPMDNSKRERMLKANDDLATLSQGMLPKCTGAERFATVSTSHTTAFLKAVEQQCKTPEESLSAGGCLSFDLMAAKGDDLKAMISSGWEWICISSQVETCCEALPSFLQQALNSILVQCFVFCETYVFERASCPLLCQHYWPSSIR